MYCGMAILAMTCHGRDARATQRTNIRRSDAATANSATALRIASYDAVMRATILNDSS